MSIAYQYESPSNESWEAEAFMESVAEAARTGRRYRPLALAALAILAVVTSPLTLIVGIAASSAVLVAVAIADTLAEGDRTPSRAA